jgi:hypothetical protein
MSFLKILKRDKVPDELPDIVIEGVKDNKIAVSHLTVESKTQDIPKENNEEEIAVPIKDSPVSGTELWQKSLEPRKNIMPKETLYNQLNPDNEGFFNELQEDLTKEVKNLDALEKWYNDKFLPEDIITNMRSYWENKKKGAVIKMLGKGFQEKISQRILSLQELEKQWQDNYFALIEKEEEIKEQEEELKKMLKEFIELCKRKKRKK